MPNKYIRPRKPGEVRVPIISGIVSPHISTTFTIICWYLFGVYVCYCDIEDYYEGKTKLSKWSIVALCIPLWPIITPYYMLKLFIKTQRKMLNNYASLHGRDAHR